MGSRVTILIFFVLYDTYLYNKYDYFNGVYMYGVHVII